ncbi:RagB/SusD family nutrient uptake outer membrane protein [Solitalea canadensis]|uniref:RagB/SusD family protein n=1 Tax=Solitalea canadensis (strain ATCC 29591 / DSM 3403 / JCM 21819 / LMG 8368 / NBRC 15130 / NCIMB 12057 / USAM 9D) TaxID=929556 RepID=H8KWF7_SOLCM|nr:RagB/SusD family nutrient uptake outer membrane protein [Solitalea canadensis]AFD08075.1 RagB/SusD family protein [Solitalea canadensis DSM 3403]
MKKTLIYTCILSTSMLFSCNNFLDQLPDSRSPLNNKEQIAELLTSAYPKASYIGFCEVMSDNAGEASEGSFYDSNARAFAWSDNYQPDAYDSPQTYWSACYAAIAVANQALEAIPENDKLYNAQRGEALVARAYSHFMLVNLFSKFYDQATAGNDPGIPYLTKPDTKMLTKYDRKSVAYVYEMIEKDLVAGMPLIDNNEYKVPGFHFNRSATYAFATRFYLFKKDYDNALKYAQLAFPGNTIGDYMRPTKLYRSKDAAYIRENFTRASEPSNLLLGEAASMWYRMNRAYTFGVNSEKISNIITGSNVNGAAWAISTYQVYGDGVKFAIKFREHFVTTSIGATTGEPYIMAPLFVTDEVLFNRAEAKIYKQDYDGALNDLNIFVAKNSNATSPLTYQKIENFYGSDLSKEQGLLATLLDFKRVAFIHEGMRWFDNIRYNMPIEHVYYNGSRIQLATNDPRRIMQLPPEATLSGLELNPR